MRLQGVAIGWAIAVAAATAADAATGVTVQLFQFRPDRPDGAFDITLGGKGATASADFPKAGTYTYFCKRHQHMRGEVNVN